MPTLSEKTMSGSVTDTRFKPQCSKTQVTVVNELFWILVGPAEVHDTTFTNESKRRDTDTAHMREPWRSYSKQPMLPRTQGST
jgi:hypothetical protein